jgi:hypothetical protein
VALVAEAKARGARAHLRRGHPPPAPVRSRHRRLRRQLPAHAAAARSGRPRPPARGVADGTIDAICSDHTPVDEDAKQVPFGEAEPGATGLELLLPLTLQWGREG